MKKKVVAFVVLFLLVFAGMIFYGNNGKSSDNNTFAGSLYAAKNPYLENTNANKSLIQLIGLSSYGKYTISIDDNSHPYTLKIRFMYLHSGTDLSTMDENMVNTATLLLALIADCEQVSWTYPEGSSVTSGSVGVDYINERFGIDVKAAGKDEDTFTALCNQLFPNKAPVTEE